MSTLLLYKTVRTFYIARHEPSRRVEKRAVGALVTAEVISVLGTRMTYLALPWFVLVTTGRREMSLVLAAEIAPMAILGIPSGARYSASARGTRC